LSNGEQERFKVLFLVISFGNFTGLRFFIFFSYGYGHIEPTYPPISSPLSGLRSLGRMVPQFT
jgi:hypothetical protein